MIQARKRGRAKVIKVRGGRLDTRMEGAMDEYMDIGFMRGSFKQK